MSDPIQYCEILIIAAGRSKRLGQPKQLLLFEGKTLINRLIDNVQAAGPFPITLVLGADADKVEAQLTVSDIQIVVNKNWEEGMGSSIRFGLEKILHRHQQEQMNLLDGVMILVCDQPLVSKEHFLSLLEVQKEKGVSLVASAYEDVWGTPALFHKDLFPALLGLKGDKGARKIIIENQIHAAMVTCDQGKLDIDTWEDYHKLLKQQRIANDC